jgi:hypothetical protein
MTEKSIDLRLVFTKTDSGTLEVTERKLGLSQTARRVLILIDGQRRLSDLAGMARPNELIKVIEELQTKDLIRLTGIAEGPNVEDLRARDQQLAVVVAELKKALDGKFHAELGNTGHIFDERVKDCVNLDVMRRVLREGIDAVLFKNGDRSAQNIVSVVRPILSRSFLKN